MAYNHIIKLFIFYAYYLNYKQSLKLVRSVTRLNFVDKTLAGSLTANYKQSLKLVRSQEIKTSFYFFLTANYTKQEN